MTSLLICIFQQNFESYDPYETARKMEGKVPEEEVVGRLTVDPPSTGFDPSDKDPDLDDDEEQEQLHPLTSEELKMKVLASVCLKCLLEKELLIFFIFRLRRKKQKLRKVMVKVDMTSPLPLK